MRTHDLPEPPPANAMDALAVCAMLDSLGIALCTYDAQLRAVRWNRTFLKFFPEHAGRIHVGEHYRDNLARFHRGRIAAPESQPVDQFVDDGVRRHLNQTRPFTFFHHGRWLRVTCQPDAAGSTTRVWMSLPSAAVSGRPLPSDGPATSDAPAEPSDHASFDNVADGVMVLDPRGRIVSVNEEFVRLYRIASRASVVGLEFRDVVAAAWRAADPARARVDDPDDERQASHPTWQLALADHAHFTGAPFELPLPDDRWIRVMAHEAADHMRYSVHVNVTAFKRQERDLRDAERQARQNAARFRAAFDHAGIATGLIDADTAFVDVNAALCRLLGAERDALVSSRLTDLLAAADAVALGQAIADLRNGQILRFEHDMMLSRDVLQQAAWVRLSCTPVSAEPGVLAALLVAQLQDITSMRIAESERDRLMEKLQYQATHDPLTGLCNRTHFEVQVSGAIAALERAPAGGPADGPPAPALRAGPTCLCFFDLDGFKAINDTAGHAAGDAALREVAALFVEEVGRDGLVARVGGDEFAALLHRCDTDRARAIAARIVGRLRRDEFRWNGVARRLGVSIGLTALYRPDTLADALHRADAACYAAKRSGSSQVRTAPAPAATAGDPATAAPPAATPPATLPPPAAPGH
ncbi:MAG: diguanylate cyclase [Xylophilus ampelinus]